MFIHPSASGRVEGWRHHNEPSHNYKMAAKNAIMIYYPRAAAFFIYRRAKEFKKNSSSRRTRVLEELNMIHYPRAAACLFTRLRAEQAKVGGTMMSLPTTTKWQQRAPS